MFFMVWIFLLIVRSRIFGILEFSGVGGFFTVPSVLVIMRKGIFLAQA